MSCYRVLVGLFSCFVSLSTAYAAASADILTFHGNRQRQGWEANETTLTPANVSRTSFGPLWSSPGLDQVTINGQTYDPHLYASPLYLDNVEISAGTYAGGNFSTIFAATNNGYVYAINAFATPGTPSVAPGTILWRSKLSNVELIPGLDGNLPLGILGTPIIDTSTTPPRLYVVSSDVDSGWQVYALDVTSGAVLPGWPVKISASTLDPVNKNGPTTWQGHLAQSQRGALNLSLDGSVLYVPFGAYNDGGAGWMVSIDTLSPRVVSAFAGAPSSAKDANGGMWSSGGPSLDLQGHLYVTTGNSPPESKNTPGYWGQSLLVWNPSTDGILNLFGTYTPFNYCQMDQGDVDLAGSSPIIIPDLDPTTTSTPQLLAFGGKQGNIYLVNRAQLPGSLVSRQPCSQDSASDGSLLPPGNQPQFNAPGPLNVFGPYSEDFNNADYAKARTTPAYFQAADGTPFLYVSGSTKTAIGATTPKPFSVARLKIVTQPGAPAYLATDATDSTLSMLTPGSPVLTSNGSQNAIVWVMDANVFRTASLVGPNVPHPVLYALDAQTLQVLWQTNPSDLHVGGKYNIPAIANGVVFVGTDRIQAFGLKPPQTVATAINSGGGAVGSFLADTDVTGGHADTFTNQVDTSEVTNPAPQAVYQSKRTGSDGVGFTYTVPNLNPGASYTVRLHFTESTWTAPNQRLFNVAVNGTQVLANFDIFQAAGGAFKAVVEQFAATANSSGQIVIQYSYGSAGNPLASGVEVLSP